MSNFADKLNATLLALDTDVVEARSFWTCDVDAAVTALLLRRADAFWRIARLGSFMAENRLPLNNIHTLWHFSESDELTSSWLRRPKESGCLATIVSAGVPLLHMRIFGGFLFGTDELLLARPGGGIPNASVIS